MRKLLCWLLLSVILLALGACNRLPEVDYHPSGFADGDILYVNRNGKTYAYERYQGGIGELTKKTELDMFIMDTAIEGVVWTVYSTEEYPDLSYVLVISGTNSAWTYRIAEQTQ